MCLSVSVYERQCTDDPPEKNLGISLDLLRLAQVFTVRHSDRADRKSVDRYTDPADRGAASWNFIVSQKNRKSAPGSFCKHPFDSFHRSGDFSGELPACTGGV